MSGETSSVSSIQTDLLFRLGVPSYREIWVVDFEFGSGQGENPEPVCLVAWELRTGQRLRLWRDELGAAPPYSTGADALFVAYYASAELGCHLALGWPLPQRVLDLFAEFRNRKTGFRLATVPAYWALSAISDWTGSAQLKRRKCAPWSCAAVLGPMPSGRKF